MQVFAFNGSPRKTWNTATLLGKALEGAASRGADTRLVHLYDLAYTGCKSCFGCKTKGGPSFGTCALRDDLTPILDQVLEADALLLGSPILLLGPHRGDEVLPGAAAVPVLPLRPGGRPGPDPLSQADPRRLHLHHGRARGADAPVRLRPGHRPQRDVPEAGLRAGGVHGVLLDTYQFEDYARIDQTRFDVEAKRARRESQFPRDCRDAYDLGVRLASL